MGPHWKFWATPARLHPSPHQSRSQSRTLLWCLWCGLIPCMRDVTSLCAVPTSLFDNKISGHITWKDLGCKSKKPAQCSLKTQGLPRPGGTRGAGRADVFLGPADHHLVVIYVQHGTQTDHAQDGQAEHNVTGIVVINLHRPVLAKTLRHQQIGRA